MHIFATFEHSLYLELAITELEQKGIEKEKIFAISLDRQKSKHKILDNIHYSDGISFVDGATVLGSLFMVLGAIYGFLLEWGPIVWGLIGLISGIVLGGVVDFYFRSWRTSKKGKKPQGKPAEVIVIVNCLKEQASWVEDVLMDHFTTGLAKFEKNNLQ